MFLNQKTTTTTNSLWTVQYNLEYHPHKEEESALLVYASHLFMAEGLI